MATHSSVYPYVKGQVSSVGGCSSPNIRETSVGGFVFLKDKESGRATSSVVCYSTSTQGGDACSCARRLGCWVDGLPRNRNRFRPCGRRKQSRLHVCSSMLDDRGGIWGMRCVGLPWNAGRCGFHKCKLAADSSKAVRGIAESVAKEFKLYAAAAGAGGVPSNGSRAFDQQEEEVSISGDGEVLVSGFGWLAREVDIGSIEELRVVADVQARAFHTPAPAFDDLFFDFFKAEVLSALLYRVRTSAPNRYSCLIAETATDPSSGEVPKIVGAVDVTAYGDTQVLSHLDGAKEYLYVSGMAVNEEHRRQGVATLLLEACDLRARQWNFENLVLHAYEDDPRARALYSRAGYEVVASDPSWMSAWLGRRRRVLMVKKSSNTSFPF